jgi:glycosyltransferase involved in cell wall biosynthesis
MASEPLVSVVMPVHHEQPDRLVRAVESVLQQSHNRLELVLVSDDGMDYAQELPVLLGRHDSRIRYASTGMVGAGPSAARNVALELVLGDAVAFLDSDDVMEPMKLAIMGPLAMAYGVAFDNTRYEFEDGAEPGGIYLPGTPDGFRAPPFFLDIPWPLIAVYNRRRFPGARFASDIRFAEDMLFNFTLLADNHGAYFVGRPLHLYAIRPLSMSHGPDSGERADQAYGQIIHRLFTANAPRLVIDAMVRKREVNRAYLAWLRSTPGSYHDFIRHAAGADDPFDGHGAGFAPLAAVAGR